MNINENKNNYKIDIKIKEIPDNKNRRNIKNNNNVNLNLDKYNKSSKIQENISHSSQSNINILQKASIWIKIQITLNNVNKINKNINCPISNQRWNINSKDNRKVYNNSPL